MTAQHHLANNRNLEIILYLNCYKSIGRVVRSNIDNETKATKID